MKDEDRVDGVIFLGSLITRKQPGKPNGGFCMFVLRMYIHVHAYHTSHAQVH